MVFVSNGGKLKHYTVPNGLLFNTYSAQVFIWTHDDCTGISKTILVKDGHGLENNRLNLFRVLCRILFHTLKNVIIINNFFYFFGTTIDLPAPFFESQS
jgi:hypothetical protein